MRAVGRLRHRSYKDKAGKYRFRMKAGNGEIIATGEAHESKSACQAEDAGRLPRPATNLDSGEDVMRRS
ncbi:DUF1508 domain-containing protein [Nocardia transvalensis]|nr:DUF1508 domain-containing protein [Nocardia transvalensis]